MRRSVRCTADAFTFELVATMAEIADGVSNGMPEIVKQACEVSKDEVTARAKATFKVSPSLKGKYLKSWKYKVDGYGQKVTGHVYSSVPGLPHLLEKGHANINGGRDVQAYPHIAPAAEVGFDFLGYAMDKLVDQVLG